MCTFVTVQQGNAIFDCTNHGELTEALGGEPVYKLAAREQRVAEDCLCHFDAAATAGQYGYTYDPAKSSWGDILLEKA